jgi:hypothetical protein
VIGMHRNTRDDVPPSSASKALSTCDVLLSLRRRGPRFADARENGRKIRREMAVQRRATQQDIGEKSGI